MLKIDHLVKNYNTFSLDCSLEVLPGQITGLVGKNGAGKSTIFHAVLGLIRPDSGKITVLGKDSQEITAKDKQKLGAALSDSGFSGNLTIQDIISVLEKLYDDFNKNFFMKQVEIFGLPYKKKLKDFSTGMKAKLKVLIAISHQAKLLLLDEPTAGLDVVDRNEVLDLISDYMAEDEERAVLISSHISSDLESLCDDFYMLKDGKIIFHEETDVLLDQYVVLKVDEAQYEKLDKSFILKVQKENYGYACLTNENAFYIENYPQIIIEKAAIDEIVTMLSGGDEQC